MTKERLGQLNWLKLEIEELSGRIGKLESVLAGRASQIDGMPWLGGKRDMVGELVPKLADLQAKLAVRREEALDEYRDLERFIAGIEDSQVRLIFILRYMDGLSWYQVAFRLGGNTADSVRMVHNRYLDRQNAK